MWKHAAILPINQMGQRECRSAFKVLVVFEPDRVGRQNPENSHLCTKYFTSIKGGHISHVRSIG